MAEEKNFGKKFNKINDLNPGAYISVQGTLSNGRNDLSEIKAASVDVHASADLTISPNPWKINGLEHVSGRQIFDFPGVYIANDERAAVLRIKTNFVNSLHDYFQKNKFTLVEPPILTNKILYDEETSVKAEVHDEDVYLSQCATFELEPLATVFGKVYTISPAFRNEKSGSKRHLAEYTHAKAEVLLADMEDLMLLAGESLYHSLKKTSELSQDELDIIEREIDFEKIHPKNHEHIDYKEAIEILQKKGSTIEYGEGISSSDEKLLTSHVGEKYIWIKKLPFKTEGFPYKRCSERPELSMTSDLIAPNGAGEMVGVAEKTETVEELVGNIVDKGKKNMIPNYWEYILLRKYGMPKHGGLGAAPERIIYGLLDLDHIRLTKPWPRYPGRKIDPEREEFPTWGDEELENIIDKYDL